MNHNHRHLYPAQIHHPQHLNLHLRWFSISESIQVIWATALIQCSILPCMSDRMHLITGVHGLSFRDNVLIEDE